MTGKALILSLSLLTATPCISAFSSDFHTAMMESTFKIDGKTTAATCFIIGKPLEGNKLAPVLITADHVLTRMPEDIVTLVLRQKCSNGTNSWTRLEYPIAIRKNGLPLWDTHEEADLAGLFLALPSNTIQNLLTTDILIEDKDIAALGIHPGTELFCLGYPLLTEGNPQGFPILKRGSVASYPLTPTRETKTFLMDCPVFGGNSGTPVYVVLQNPAINGEKAGMPYSGIMGITIEDKRQTKTTQLFNDKGQEIGREAKSTSLQLGVVVHASFIKELIDDMVVPVEKGPPNEAL